MEAPKTPTKAPTHKRSLSPMGPSTADVDVVLAKKLRLAPLLSGKAGAPTPSWTSGAAASPPPRPSCESVRIETEKREHATRLRRLLWGERRNSLADADVCRSLDFADVAPSSAAPAQESSADHAA